ncbi:MAG: glycerophosphodiester phosphodiesterase family protein [Jhaorihella sp.]
MIPPLPGTFLGAPIAHRALHDRARGRPENSRAAVRAAVAAGYGIEIDLQISADGQALVFHDSDLMRLTGRPGSVRSLSARQAGAVPLLHGDGEGIPTLNEVLEIVAGQVALLIEIKDQTGSGGPGIGPLEAAVVRALGGYAGPVAVMSFNPLAVAEMARIAPGVARGLVTCSWDDPEDRAGLDPATIARLRAIADFEPAGAAFISHEAADLTRPRVAALRAGGVPVLCWTIRSPGQERAARRHADNITFEDYLAALPA